MALFWENRLIDNETGEVTYKKTNPKFQKVNKDGYLFKANSRKIVTYQNIDLPDTLQDHEIAKFYKLKNNIEKGSNFIRIKTYKGYRNATVDDLAEIWNVSIRQAQRTFKESVQERCYCCHVCQNEYDRKGIGCQSIIL